MLNINLINTIIIILAENGETRTLTLIKLINSYIHSIKIMEPMVFEHIINTNNELSIPYNIKTDWGDGHITQTGNHIYKNIDKKYRVKVYGDGKQLKIPHIHKWPCNIVNFISIGRIGIRSLKSLFEYNHHKFKIHPNWDTTNIIDMSFIFLSAINFNQKIGDNWDTSNVRNMSGMFYNARIFNQKIGDSWDISQVTDMSYMFFYASNFNQRIGDNWNTSRVTNMCCVFWGACKLNQKFGDNWNTSRVTNITCMFPDNLSEEFLPVWYKSK